MRGNFWRLAVSAASILFFTPLQAGVAVAAVPGTNDLVSSSSAGVHGNKGSYQLSLSGDGRYVAFISDATNLVTGDTNNKLDIFVKDRTAGTTDRVSVDSTGTQANDDSYQGRISADGRYVVFTSPATNLVAGDTNGTADAFMYDRQTSSTTLISKSTGGTIGNAYSGDPSISNDGRYIVFQSDATNLVSGDTNAKSDIFVRDTKLGTTTRVNLSIAGTQANDNSAQSGISGDGRYIVFSSNATNLDGTSIYPGVFLVDRVGGVVTNLTLSANAGSGNVSISNDGSTMAFVSDATNLIAGDTNSVADTFVYSQASGVISRVSVSSGGTQANADSFDIPTLSGDGRYVAFGSAASNLDAADTDGVSDAFLHDRQGGTTELLSKTSTVKGNDGTSTATISADGQYVGMMTRASNLFASDTNADWDDIVGETGNSAVTYCSQ